jgi:hypothetical protein
MARKNSTGIYNTNHQTLYFEKDVSEYSTLREVLSLCEGNLDAQISLDNSAYDDSTYIRLAWSRPETDQERDQRVAKWKASEAARQERARAKQEQAEKKQAEQQAAELALYQSLHAKYGNSMGDS